VWGEPLPGASAESVYEIVSVAVAGAGLLVYHRARSDVPRTLLKVAQPTSGRLEAGLAEIGQARYVSWNGCKLVRRAGIAAVVPEVEAPFC
jgi:hypothetical protein